ncbi:MAG: FAD-dependent oxidoreductase [Planctomycetaceae bacterium]|nr:FAD-dependent oxidoreductase [Planctomycetaceae bacterium]
MVVKTPNGPLNPRVAVIGAGISGLIGARTLVDLGFEVTVFEKSRGLGGRTATRRADPALSFDHGAQYFTARDPHFVQQVETWIARGIVAEWTGRIVTIEGAMAWPKIEQPRRYVGVPGMTAIAQHLAAALHICRDTRIVRLDHVDQAWQVMDAIGQEHGPYSHVIVSLPSPQAADLLFDHAFAAETRAIPMTPCWAVMAAFERRIEAAWDGAFVHGCPLAWVARNSSKPGRDCSNDCWVLHASPDWSAAHLDDDRDSVKATLLSTFAEITAAPALNPVHLDAHRWLYSATPLLLDRLVLTDHDAGLIVCGDWLAGGRVEGAFHSGVAAADCVLRHIGIPSEKQLPLRNTVQDDGS